jgi:hypothetical protein
MQDEWGFDGAFDSSNDIDDDLQDFGLSQWSPGVPQGPYACPAGQVFDTARGLCVAAPPRRMTPRRVGLAQATTTPSTVPTTSIVLGVLGGGLVAGTLGYLALGGWNGESGVAAALGAAVGGIAGYYIGKPAPTVGA